MAWGNLFQGTPPPSMNTQTVSQQNLPAWYQELTRSIASQAADAGSQGYQAYGGDRLAGFNPDQVQAFDMVRQNAGGYQPYMQGALGAANNITGSANPYMQTGLNAVNNAQNVGTGNWLQNAGAYMNPYMNQVTDEIARLGNRNFTENIMPQVDSTFVGSGQFGSSRNADILGRAMRDTQRDITGQQSQALQQGYNQSAQIYGNDASRALQADTTNANTNLQKGQIMGQYGQIAGNLADTQAGRLGALGQTNQQLGQNSATQMEAVGAQQRAWDQQRMDLNYGDFQRQQQYPWQQLNNMNSIVRGMQLPQSQETISAAPAANYGPSPLALAAGVGSAVYGATKKP